MLCLCSFLDQHSSHHHNVGDACRNMAECSAERPLKTTGDILERNDWKSPGMRAQLCNTELDFDHLIQGYLCK